MGKTIITIVAFILFSGATGYAQADSTRYIRGLPVSDDDTARQFPQEDLEPQDKIMVVPPYKLPSEVREALENQPQYQGWQDSTVYFDKNTRLYIVPVKNNEGIELYGLNENGEPVTFNVVAKPAED
jgi:hypothetical protein